MTNIFSSMFNYVGDWFAQKLASYMQDPLGNRYTVLHDYYSGDHRPQLKRPTEPGKQDDNVTQNFVGLTVDRSYSRLYRGGVTWKLPEGRTAQQEYLDKVWDVNKKEIILIQNGLYGASYGTWYFKINPDGIIDPYTDEPYPRLIPLNPRIIRIKTDAQDMNEVSEYRIEYTCIEERGNRKVAVTHLEITKRPIQEYENEDGERYNAPATTWTVETYEQVGSAPMRLISSIPWPYEFPPIIHCKNLPSLEGCYGDSEIDDTINVQDKQNFTTSNTGKIIKFHANPVPTITGVSASEVSAIDVAGEKAIVIPNKDAKIGLLEMESDLASSRAFALDLRKSIFDIGREVDISSLEGHLGDVTNFGLRVLYTDAIDKTDTKRQLYGDALKELNRRLLVLNGWTGEMSNPGEVVWGDVMPSNILEDMQVDQFALDKGLVDKETVYNQRYKARYGAEWATVTANLDKQKAGNSPLIVKGSMITDGGQRTLESMRYNGKEEAIPERIANQNNAT